MELYSPIKWLHVLLSMIALGANLTYGVWLARAGTDPVLLPFVLRGVKILDDRIANPAYGLLLVTGVIMVINSGLPWSTPWLSLAMGLYVLIVLLGLFRYTPTLRKQIAVVSAGGAASQEYQTLAARGRNLGIMLAILVVAVVYLMVAKPALWRG